jgi:hypothetical protein
VGSKSHTSVGVILEALAANLWTLVIYRERRNVDHGWVRCRVLAFFMLLKLGKSVFFYWLLDSSH